ncbi:DCXR [Mytilus edulis]|uniref:DCXR n=1 Tax=Mytilus edulis TaxID=6550 RepID=A0A8S3Q8P0_MYTED|nr:DCXR [Mytilus edulis]
MEVKLDGKRALVTGAGKGFGREIAKRIAECGAETFALSRTQEDLDSLKSEVPNINIINVDLQDWDKTREEVSKIGHIDLLVNNAGVICRIPFIDTPKEEIDRGYFEMRLEYMFVSLMKQVKRVSTNVYVYVNCVTKILFLFEVIAKRMIEKGKGGSIVNISSIASRTVLPGASAYCSTKGAVDNITRCMALELGPHNIRVNSVNPTFVITNMTKDKSIQCQVYSENTNGEVSCDEIRGESLRVDGGLGEVLNQSDESGMISGESLRVDGGLGVYGTRVMRVA